MFPFSFVQKDSKINQRAEFFFLSLWNLQNNSLKNCDKVAFKKHNSSLPFPRARPLQTRKFSRKTSDSMHQSFKGECAWGRERERGGPTVYWCRKFTCSPLCRFGLSSIRGCLFLESVHKHLIFKFGKCDYMNLRSVFSTCEFRGLRGASHPCVTLHNSTFEWAR